TDNIHKSQACVTARQDVINECFGGAGDAGHTAQIQQELNLQARCRALKTQAGCPYRLLSASPRLPAPPTASPPAPRHASSCRATSTSSGPAGSVWTTTSARCAAPCSATARGSITPRVG